MEHSAEQPSISRASPRRTRVNPCPVPHVFAPVDARPLRLSPYSHPLWSTLPTRFRLSVHISLVQRCLTVQSKSFYLLHHDGTSVRRGAAIVILRSTHTCHPIDRSTHLLIDAKLPICLFVIIAPHPRVFKKDTTTYRLRSPDPHSFIFLYFLYVIRSLTSRIPID